MATLATQGSPVLDWTTLKTQAAPYTSLVSTTDPVSGLVDVTYYGLQTSLSEVMKNAPAHGLHGVAIFADTLVLDVATVAAAGLLLVARSLDVTQLAGQPLMVAPGTKSDVIAQVLVGGTTGGALRLTVAGQEASAVAPPVGTDAARVTTYVSADGAAFNQLPSGDGAAYNGLLGSAWMMNTLYASYSAAAWLMEDTVQGASVAAQAMLAWIVTCTTSLVANNNLPSDYSQLYNQASALLVTLNVAPGATFVPVLSGTYYSQHTSDIITVIRDYESKLSTLDTQTDIVQAIATVSAALQSVATDEVAPLQVQLDSLSANSASLFDDITTLRNQFQLQSQRAHTAFEVLVNESALAAIMATLKAALDMTLSGISLCFDAAKAYEGDVGALKDAVSDGVATIQNLIATIQQGQGGGGVGDDLSAQAAALLQTQMATMQVVLDARLLYQQALANQSGGVLPTSLAAVTIDPLTDWDNYLAAVEAQISSVKRSVGDGAQDAADNYLASLKILAGYGKAIGGKFGAYVAQLVQAAIVMAQIKAANDVEQRWADVQANATSEAEKLAALKALVQGRMQAMKRSLYLAWTYYAASYFYLNFQSPPRVLHLDMSAAEMEVALVGVADWVAQALSSTPDGQHVQLPSTSASIELDFAILQQGGEPAGAGDAALLSKLDDGSWSLVFTVPLGSSQLDGVLPNSGNVAIWITEASFFLDGITPNSKGNVIALISTSGTYQNGFGAAHGYTFVTKGLSGNYAYRAVDENVYSSWLINSAVYMTPTPYSQWNVFLAANGGDPSTATRLRVVLKVVYATS